MCFISVTLSLHCHTHLYDSRYSRLFTVAVVKESQLTHFHIPHEVTSLKDPSTEITDRLNPDSTQRYTTEGACPKKGLDIKVICLEL